MAVRESSDLQNGFLSLHRLQNKFKVEFDPGEGNLNRLSLHTEDIDYVTMVSFNSVIL